MVPGEAAEEATGGEASAEVGILAATSQFGYYSYLFVIAGGGRGGYRGAKRPRND